MLDKKKPQNQSMKSISGLSNISDMSETEGEDYIELSRKLHQKDCELEELKKTIRFMEFTHKKTLIEKENELKFEKIKVENLMKDMDSQQIVQIANNLQKQLADKEEEIFNIKDSALNLKKELMNLKQNNLQLKNANNVLNQYPSSKNQRGLSMSIASEKLSLFLRPAETSESKSRKRMSSMMKPITNIVSKTNATLVKIDEKVEINENNKNKTPHDLLFACIKKLQEENQSLQEDIMSIKESAIETVVERDKELIDLKNRNEEIENIYKDQIDILKNENELLKARMDFFEGGQDIGNGKFSLKELANLEHQLESLKNLYRNEKVEFEIEKDKLEQKIREMMIVNENQELNFRKNMEKISKEMDERINEKVYKDTYDSKEVQSELLKELQNNEEKFRNLEKKYFTSQYELKIQSGKSEKEINDLKFKLETLKESIHINEENIKNLTENEKKLEIEKKKLMQEIELKQEKIVFLENAKNELMKKFNYTENELNSLKMSYNLIRESYDAIKLDYEQLQFRNDEDMKNFQISIGELDQRYNEERNNLELEIKRLKENHENDNNSKEYPIMNLLNELEFRETKSPIQTAEKNEKNDRTTSPSPKIRVSILENDDNVYNTYNKFEDIPIENNYFDNDNNNYLYNNFQKKSSENKEKEIRIQELEAKIQEIESLNQALEEEIEKNKKTFNLEISLLLEEKKKDIKETQNLRKKLIEKTDDEEKDKTYQKNLNLLNNEINNLKKELKESKEIWENEQNFLKEEVFRSEQKAKDDKLLIMKIMQEKETYQKKCVKYNEFYQKLKKDKEQKNAEGKLFGFNLSFFRR